MTIIFYDLAAKDGRRFSGNAWRTCFALAHKELEFETRSIRYIDIKAIADGNQHSVPVIEDGGIVVRESWDIALYLEEAYPDRPSLFGAPVGKAYARHLNNWINTVLSKFMLGIIIKDVYNHLQSEDKSYFRQSRVKRFGKSLDEMVDRREHCLLELRDALAPLRAAIKTQPFLGGSEPLYPDYLMAALFQWGRAICPVELIEHDDPLYAWFGRMLDLFNGLCRKQTAYWSPP